MREPKKILLVVVVFILLFAVVYLTYLLSDGKNPLVMFNTRANFENDPLFSQGSDPIPSSTLTPTRPAYNSTSPTQVQLSPSITAGTSPTLQPTLELTPSPTPTNEPSITVTNVTPTVLISQLPVAGDGNHLPYFIIGGVLVFLAILL